VPDAVKYSVGIVEFFPCTVYNYGVDIFITGFNYLAMAASCYNFRSPALRAGREVWTMPVKIDLITGFLGAGKTTFLLR